jgi:hypothetical protein
MQADTPKGIPDEEFDYQKEKAEKKLLFDEWREDQEGS